MSMPFLAILTTSPAIAIADAIDAATPALSPTTRAGCVPSSWHIASPSATRPPGELMRTRSSSTFPSARISEITRADVRPSSSLPITPASMSVPSWRICAFGSLSAIPGPKAKRPLPARVAERGRAPSRGIVTYLNYNLGCPKFHVKSRGGNMLRLNPVDRPAAVTAVVLDAGRLPVPPCPEHFSLREADRRRTPALRTPDGRFPVGCNVIRLRLDQRAAARLPAPLRRL